MYRVLSTLSAMALAATGLAYAQAPPPEPSAAGPNAAQQRPERPPRPHRPEAAFQRADANRDGKVSYEELHAVRPNATKERFDRLDRDGDGFLTRADRPERRDGREGADAQRAFAKRVLESDANKDGKVTLDELRTSRPGFPEDTFGRLDRDNDGFISTEDLQRTRQRGDRPQRPEGRIRSGRGGPEQRAGMRERMRDADTNADGKLSQEEALAAMPGMTAERFRLMDRNSDGFLTEADRPQRPPRPRP